MFQSAAACNIGLLTLLVPFLCAGYNIDTTHSIIYSDPDGENNQTINSNKETYFGFSVLLTTGNGANFSRYDL